MKLSALIPDLPTTVLTIDWQKYKLQLQPMASTHSSGDAHCPSKPEMSMSGATSCSAAKETGGMTKKFSNPFGTLTL